MAICCLCTLEKENAAFSKSINRKSGLQTACKECLKLYRINNKSFLQKKSKTKFDSLKERAFLRLGDHCITCGERNKPFLTIDHIFNDGGSERKAGLTAQVFYKKLADGCLDLSRYQVLCFNCNCSKKHVDKDALSDYARPRAKKRYDKVKQTYLDFYGNKCQCCGETNPKYLTMEHLRISRKEHISRIGYRASNITMMTDAIKTDSERQLFGLLCFNCNCNDSYKKGLACPHKAAPFKET